MNGFHHLQLKSKTDWEAWCPYLGHCHTDATLSELAAGLGLSRADSVPTQIRRVMAAAPGSELRRQLALLETMLEVDHKLD